MDVSAAKSDVINVVVALRTLGYTVCVSVLFTRALLDFHGSDEEQLNGHLLDKLMLFPAIVG